MLICILNLVWLQTKAARRVLHAAAALKLHAECCAVACGAADHKSHALSNSMTMENGQCDVQLPQKRQNQGRWNSFDFFNTYSNIPLLVGVKRVSLYMRKSSKKIKSGLFMKSYSCNSSNVFRDCFISVPTSEREGKLSNPRARAARARCMEKS
jgi:hypothetical protein